MRIYWKSTDVLLQKLSALSGAVAQSEFLKSLDRRELEFLADGWHLEARENQRPSLADWRTWLLLGGRGSGKTRTGAEYIKGLVLKTGLYPGDTAGRIALVGSSYADVRDVMIEGESGLLGIWGQRHRPDWVPSRRQLLWPCGTVATVLSAADPDQLRGHQFGFAWSDVVSMAAGVAGANGVDPENLSIKDVSDILLQVTGVLGALVAVYGRLSARHKII